MRKVILSALLGLAIVIGGCAIVEQMKEPVTKVEKVDGVEDAVLVAQAVINEARTANTAAKRRIAARVKEEVWTPAKGQEYLNKTRDFSKKLDEAQKYLDAGNVIGAKTKADAIHEALKLLALEVAKQAQKEIK